MKEIHVILFSVGSSKTQQCNFTKTSVWENNLGSITQPDVFCIHEDSCLSIEDKAVNTSKLHKTVHKFWMMYSFFRRGSPNKIGFFSPNHKLQHNDYQSLWHLPSQACLREITIACPRLCVNLDIFLKISNISTKTSSLYHIWILSWERLHQVATL